MWIKEILSKALSMFYEVTTSETWSSTRFAFVFSVVSSNIIIFGIYAYISIKNGALQDVPEGTLWLYALANGISFAGKVVQKIKENKEQ